MSKPAPTLGLMAIAEHFFTGLRAWWQHRNELGSIDSNEFKRIAGEVGIHSASSVDGRTRTAARKTNMACGLQKISDALQKNRGGADCNALKILERAMGIEPTTLSLGS